MSDSVIRVGDRAILVKVAPCCRYSGSLGRIFTAAATEYGAVRCVHCMRLESRKRIIQVDDGSWIMAYRLRKLPPLSEPVTTEDKESVPV